MAKPQDIIRIGVTGFVPGICLLDVEGDLLRPAILHTDTRADQEMARINRLYPGVHHGHLVPKLAWVRDHESEIFRSVASVLAPHSFIVFKLTGKICCDHDTATVYGALFDEASLNWDESACADLGVPSRILPRTYPAMRTMGPISSDVAGLLGLTTGTEVIVGTGDTFATLLGTGIRGAHELMLYWGTSGTRVYTWTDPADYLAGPYFGEGKAGFIGSIFSCGESIDRMRALMGNHPWKELDSMAEGVAPGAENPFFMPHLMQRSFSGSLSAADHVIGLRDSHTPGHLYRAILEGIAYTSALDLASLERIDRVHVCGGAASSRLARTILATVLRKPVRYNPESSAALGIALIAALSVVGCGDFAHLSREWFEGRREEMTVLQEPIADWMDSYEESMRAFVSLREGLLSLDDIGKQPLFAD